MRKESTEQKCFICGEKNGFINGKICLNCGATSDESAIAHLLVKYSGGEQNSIPESAEHLKYKRMLAINPSEALQKALDNNVLFTMVSSSDLKTIKSARDGLPFERILAGGQAEQETAIQLNDLLSEDGIVISVQDPCLEKALGDRNTWQVNGELYAVYHKKKESDIEFSGERFMPGIEDQKLESEHMQRYMSARCLVKGMHVLDIACGEGYGSALLAETAISVLGMDIDPDTIHNAQKKYRKSNLSFQQGDAARIPLEDHSVDAVVSFETIEHIDEALQHQFLKEINRILKPDGILIMSTPNKAVYSDRYHYFNEFHIHEFYHDEFQQFLGQYFSHIWIYQQSFQVVSLLSSCSSQTKETAWYGHSIDQTEAKYYIAIASRTEIKLPDMTSVFVQRSGEHEENIQRIVSLQNEEVLRNLHIQKLDEELSEKDTMIQQLQEEEKERNLHIQELDSELETRGNRIQTLQAEQAERDEHIKELDSELETRGNRIQTLQEEQAKRDEHIKELDSELEKRGNRILTLQAEQAKRDEHIKELDSELETRGNRILTLQAEEAERDAHIQELDRELEMRGNRIQTLQAEQAERDAHVQELTEEISNKNIQIQLLNTDIQSLTESCAKITADRDYKEEQRNTLVKERDELKGYFQQLTKECTEQRQTIINKEAHIQLLLESDRELQRIHHSRSWKVLTKWWKFRDFLVPPNSKRRLVLKLISKFIHHPVWCMKKLDMDHIKKFINGLASGNIAHTSQRLDNYLGGGSVSTERPEQLPLQEFENMESIPPLHVPSSSHPTVSIVIPVYNQFAYTYACLKSIAKNSGDVPYEVLIADDCSTDQTRKIADVISGIKVIRNTKNLRFLKNCNNAAKHAKGKYILFLNNDTQVQEGWLQPLVTLIESSGDIGMVGSKLIYPDGRLQEAGGIIWKDASAWNYGHLQDPADPEYNYVKEADYISGAAIMIRSDLWIKLGGFDEYFAPAYYEDTDLAFQVRKAGYRVMFQPKSVVIHYEGVSNGTTLSEGQKVHQAINQKKFYEKWKDVLEREQDPNGTNLFKAKDRSQRKKHLLVVDHYVPHYDKDAGGRCTYMYLQLFVRMGFKVTFIGDNFFRHEPYTSVLNQMGIEVLYGNTYYLNWQQWLKDNANNFDYIYLQRPHISIKYIDLVKQYSNAKIIYFAHDLHHIREKREYEITHDPKLLESAENWKKIEYELFTKADVGHVVGSYEQELMEKAFPGKPIRNLPLYVYESIPEDIEKDFSKRKDLLYVGGFQHHPNVDAVLWFAKEIFPQIQEAYPDIVWHVVGGNQPKEILELASEHIIIHGFVSDEELEHLYRACRIAVVPLRYGAGVKGKVLEANYYQIPLVTTPIGAEGLSTKENSMIIEENVGEMARKIIELYQNEKELYTLSENSKTFIQNYFMLDSARKVIEMDFII